MEDTLEDVDVDVDEPEDDVLEDDDDDDPETGISNALSIPFAISSIRELKILLSVAFEINPHSSSLYGYPFAAARFGDNMLGTNALKKLRICVA